MEDDILDLISQGLYTQAHQLVAQRIKKFPGRQYFHALDHLISWKQGRRLEAETAMLALKDQHPNDLKTLGLMYNFFLDAGRPQDANGAYEDAMKRYPTAENVGFDWFRHSLQRNQYDIRVWNRIFMAMQRNHKLSRLYKYWTAFTYLLLIKLGSLSDKEEATFKVLGLRMVEPLGHENNQELFVLLQFWALNGQIDQAVAAVEKAPFDFDIMVLYRAILEDAGQHQRVWDYCVGVLAKYEDFNSTKAVIRAGKELGKSADEVVDALKQGLGDWDTLRNLWLARVELAQVFGTPVADALQAYLDRFGGKLCCVNDIGPYAELYAGLTVPLDDSLSTGAVIRRINAQKIKYLADPSLDVDAFIAENDAIVASAGEVRLAEFDLDPVSELALLSIILDLNRDSSSANVVKSLCKLERLLEKDLHNHKLLLWTTKLYTQLNCGAVLPTLYKRLLIKMVQHETLGHLVDDAHANKDLAALFVEMFRFYKTAAMEITDALSTGFNNGTFNKLELMVGFARRLHPLVLLMLCVLQNIRQLVLCNDWKYANYFAGELLAMVNEVSGLLADNRDFTTEWKLGVFSEPLEGLVGMDVKPLATDVHAWALRYLNVWSSDPAHLKLLNKHISLVKARNPFEKMLNQCYLNLFKLKHGVSDNERQLILNWFGKNMTAAKVQQAAVPADVLLGELNRNLAGFSEFAKLASLVFKRTLVPQVKKQVDLVMAELRKVRWADQQRAELDTIKRGLDLELQSGVNGVIAWVEKSTVAFT